MSVATTALVLLSGLASAGPASGTLETARPPVAADPPSAGAGSAIPPGACPSFDCPLPLAGTPRALGSTPTNRLVAPWAGEGMIVENPLNPLNLVAGGLYQEPSAYNDSATYNTSGVSGAFTSFDGGRTWTDQTLPPSPDWTNSTSHECGHIHLADSVLAFGPNGTIYYVDLSYPISPGGVTCNVTLASTGLYVTTSHDGGVTWGTPVAISGTQAYASLDKPWIAVDPVTGEVYVAYTDDHNGSRIFLQNSTDEGAHWSRALSVSVGTDSMRGVELVVDPFGGVDASWMDQSTAAIYFARSTDHGASFSVLKQVTTMSATSASPAPDTFRAFALPALAVDAFPGNAYTGALYLVWQDGSGARPGSPRILLSSSTDNGSTWSTPKQVNSDTLPEDFQPSLALGPDGTLYVGWYAENASNGRYRFAAAVSHNGGATFDRQFNVSDVNSSPSTATTGSDWWIGDYTDTIADAVGARSLWTDARASQGWYCPSAHPCLWGYVYNISFYTATIVNDSIGASMPVNVSVSGSVPSTGNLSVSPRPSPLDWIVGAYYNLSAPATQSSHGTTAYFRYWYGHLPELPFFFDPAGVITGLVAGGEHFVACFSPNPSGTCDAPGAPGWLDLTDIPSPANASVLVNGVPTAAPQATPTPEPPGTYWVNVSAPGYLPSNVSYVVTPGNTTVVTNLALVPQQGVLRGTLLPETATLTVDGVGRPVASNGSFQVTVDPGTHTLIASAPEYYAYQNASISVGPGELVEFAIVLQPYPGWINGTVSPATATVNADGVPVSVAPDGSFAVQMASGTHWINASLPGYAPATSGPVLLSPGGESQVNLQLTPYLATLSGAVAPANASVTLDGTPIRAQGGIFSLSVMPGSHIVNVSGWSYVPLSLPLTLSPNETAFLNLVLNLSVGWIAGSVNPTGATVLLGGAPVLLGPTGQFNVSAPAGVYALDVTDPGYAPWHASLTVAPGRSTVVAVSLTPNSGSSLGSMLPILVGIAVVGLAVGIGLLVHRRRGPKRPAAA